MWYVVQVRTGSEENIRIQCIKNVSKDVFEKCFIPYYEEKKRIRGEWRTEKKGSLSGIHFHDHRENRGAVSAARQSHRPD